jgi:hypothetical protein
MAIYKNDHGCSVNISPFLDNSFRFTKLKLHEAIGGSIASGMACFEFPKDKTDLIEKTYHININIQQEEGLVYKIEGVITNKKVIDNQLTIEFLCLRDISFVDETLSLNFNDITAAIEYSYIGRKDIRCVTDLANDLPLVQFCETSYDFCKRMSQSFKYDSIYTFGLEGYMIKDTIGINSFGINEWNFDRIPKVFAGTGSVMQEQLTKTNLNPQYFKNPFDSWNETMEGEEINDSNKTDHGQDEYSLQSKYAVAIINFNKYFIVHKDIRQLKKNFDYNGRFYDSSYYSNLSICHNDRLPNFKIGDLVYYRNLMEKDIKNPNKLYIAYENEILITTDSTSGHESDFKSFSWRTLLKGVEDENGSILEQHNNPSK